MQDRILDIVIKEDEISWQKVLLELVETEQMDPWDIDVSNLSHMFLQRVKELQEMDLKLSAKVFLAAAILLRVKSKRLLGADLSNLDRLFALTEEGEEQGLLDEISQSDEFYAMQRERLKGVGLIPRTPQPRSRKVSVYDLVDALQKAMEVKKRRVFRNIPEVNIDITDKKVDISDIIKTVYGKIKFFFLKANDKTERLKFSNLIPDTSKEGKVFTFIPLLHLTNERKIDLYQQQHFGEIEIEILNSKQEVDKELSISPS